jgi:hypothetical protein
VTAIVQRSFARGEVSNAFQARADLVAYSLGLKTSLNGFIRADGGWMNRAGTFISNSTKADGTARFFPFIFNSLDQNCIMEVGEYYIRFHKDGSPILIGTQAAWSNVTSYSRGDVVLYSGINYIYIFATASTNDQPDISPAFWYPMGIATDPFELYAPWTWAQVQTLRASQKANLVLFTCDGITPYQLTCTGSTNWILAPAVFIPSISFPVNVANDSASPGTNYYWGVTAVSKNDGSESILSALTGSATIGSTGTPITVTWDAHADAVGYLVYRYDGNGRGLLAFTTINQFVDYGLLHDPKEQPPEIRPEIHPSFPVLMKISKYVKERLFLANSSQDQAGVWGSRIGSVLDFTKKSPSVDDCSLKFSLTGKDNEVKHLLDVGGLWILTAGGEYFCRGVDGQGNITPGSPNPHRFSANGASDLEPIELTDSAIYIQAEGSRIRSLGFDSASGGRDGYADEDLSTFARHLFEKKEIVAWTYQKAPHSIVYMVRNDGVVVGMTYVKKQQVIAFHRLTTDGFVEDIESIPEGNEWAVYLLVRRTVDGATKRYVERMAERVVSDPLDSVFMDCAATYDGRNLDEDHMLEIAGGTTWVAEELMELESNDPYFSVGEEGNVYQIRGIDDDGEEIQINCTVENYLTDFLVQIRPDRDIPVTMRNTATWEWTRAVDELSGLDHLEGKEVSIFADGCVVGSPNNPDYTVYTVESGALSPALDRCYGVIHVGLPYISDLETLALETLNNETMANKKVNVSELTIYLENSFGIFAGSKLPTGDDPLEHLEPLQNQDAEYSETPTEITGKITVPIQGQWTNDGRAALRIVDPTPATVNAIVPTGLIPV